MDAGLALDSSNLDSAVQATLMESINDSLRDVENKAYDVSKDALYLPTKDSQCTQAVDTIEQNQKYQNRLITLKQAQNPKIKNYIESINEILISGLEAWLNNNNTSSMYD